MNRIEEEQYHHSQKAETAASFSEKDLKRYMADGCRILNEMVLLDDEKALLSGRMCGVASAAFTHGYDSLRKLGTVEELLTVDFIDLAYKLGAQARQIPAKLSMGSTSWSFTRLSEIVLNSHPNDSAWLIQPDIDPQYFHVIGVRRSLVNPRRNVTIFDTRSSDSLAKDVPFETFKDGCELVKDRLHGVVGIYFSQRYLNLPPASQANIRWGTYKEERPQ